MAPPVFADPFGILQGGSKALEMLQRRGMCLEPASKSQVAAENVEGLLTEPEGALQTVFGIWCHSVRTCRFATQISSKCLVQNLPPPKKESLCILPLDLEVQPPNILIPFIMRLSPKHLIYYEVVSKTRSIQRNIRLNPQIHLPFLLLWNKASYFSAVE